MPKQTTPLNMEGAGNNIEKWARNKENHQKQRLGAKKKSNVSNLELFQLQEGALHLFATTRGNTTNLFGHLRRNHTAQ